MDLNAPLATRLRKQMVAALSDFQMIEDGDRVMVAVSGGKDSSILLALLNDVRKRAKIQFTLEAVMLDQKQPGFDADHFRSWVESQQIKFTLLEEDTYSIVKEKVPEGKTYCSLCSRLRRGILYRYARENGLSKVALGHHRDDIVETMLLNLFFSGKTAAMPPKLRSDDGANILIRPLSYIAESDLVELSKQWAFPIVPCNLCGSQDGLNRQRVKRMLADYAKDYPDIHRNVLAATANVRPSQLLDQSLWNFTSFSRTMDSF